jgi:cation/acetate symporter
MSSEMYDRIRENPKFRELVSKRERLAWTLTGIVLVLFFGLFMTVAFNPTVLAIRLGESFVTTGLLIGLAQFILFWVLTAVYVTRANSEFDAMTEQLLRESMKVKK